MESFSEYPGVEEGADRRLDFPKINWLSIPFFTNLVNDETTRNQIHPFIENKFTNKNPLYRRTFVGKTVPTTTNPDNRMQNSLGSLPYDELELIGTVFYSVEHLVWKIRVTVNGISYDLENNFIVLHIRNPESFYWSSNVGVGGSEGFERNNSCTAKYALKAAVNVLDSQYNYIGRSLEELQNSTKRPKYYSNGWYNFDEHIPQIYGKINKTYKLMFIPLKSLEVGLDQFETLCLKVSPAPLKILCRTAVRSYVNYSQKNIKSINSVEHQLIPESLIDFLKYPAYLAVGEYMLSNEKLVGEDDRFELAFDSTGNLVCRALHEECTGQQHTHNLSQIERQKLESVVHRNIDLIWIHRLKAVFSSRLNSIVETIYSVSGVSSYKFCIEWETANYHIKTL